MDKWNKGIESEINFWDNWLASKGNGSAEYLFRLDPDAELQDEIKALVKVARPSILDVGAGPLTFLGKKINGKMCHIVAVDALADKFFILLAKHGINPIIWTRLCDSERIDTLSDRLHHRDELQKSPAGVVDVNYGLFDIITARNTLDHSYDPMKAILNMPKKLKPGGVIYMEHIINEGECSEYEGFHQWNFNLVDGDLILSDKEKKFNVTQIFTSLYPGSTFEHRFHIQHEIITIIRIP